MVVVDNRVAITMESALLLLVLQLLDDIVPMQLGLVHELLLQLDALGLL